MMYFTIFSLLLVICSVFGADEKYSTKFDTINIDDVLKSERLVKNYVDCILDRGTSCTPEGEAFKGHIIDGLQTGCSKCSEVQKKNVGKIAQFLSGKKEPWWDEIKAKYDPKGEFKAKYEKFAKEQGLDL